MQSLSVPEHLLDSIRAGRCVLFGGAGLSIPLGLPAWLELVRELIIEVRKIDPIKGQEFDEQLTYGQLTQVAQYAKEELGSSAYFDALLRCFRKPVLPHENHHLITEIPFRGIITTNYDKMTETAFTLRTRQMPFVFTPLSISALASVLLKDRYYIFKLHGDIDHPESIILTKQDYDRILFGSPHVKTFLQTVLAQNTVLFVGYSLSDPDFELIMSELSFIFSGTTPPHYALLPQPDPIKARDLKRRLNIRSVAYDPANGHEELTEIFRNMRAVTTKAE